MENFSTEVTNTILRDFDDLMRLATSAPCGHNAPYLLVSIDSPNTALALDIRRNEIVSATPGSLIRGTQMTRRSAETALQALNDIGVRGWVPLPVREAVALQIEHVIEMVKGAG